MNASRASIFTVHVVLELDSGLRRFSPTYVAARNQAEAVERWRAQHVLDHFDAPGAPPPEAYITRDDILAEQSGDAGVLTHSQATPPDMDQAAYDHWLSVFVRGHGETFDFVGYAIEDLNSGDVTYVTDQPSTKALLRQGLSEWRVTEEWGDRRLVSHAEDDGSDRSLPYDTPCLQDHAPLEHFTERG